MAIEHLISPEAIEQFKQLKKIAADNTAEFEKMVAAGVELNNTLGKADTFSKANKGAAALSQNEELLTQKLADLQKANEKLNKLYDDQAKKIDGLNKKLKDRPTNKPSGGSTGANRLDKEQEKLNNLYSAEAQEIAKVVEQRKLLNRINRENARDAIGLTDAYEELDRAYKAAARTAQNLALTLGETNEETIEAVKVAQQYDQQLKAADAAVGRFNRNVGNYSGALKVLEKALTDVRGKLDAYTKSGKQNEAVLEQLQKEEKLLNQLVQSQASGFAKATQEVKANTVALQQLALAGMEGTEAYKNLFNETAALKEEVGDLGEALKAAEPGEFAFNAAADAARGLIGLYGLAASATAALGIENQAFEETLVKLQAAETALQSIEAIRVLFKKESAFQQAISIALSKIEILQTNLLTAAESKNIIVRYAAIAAQKALNAVMGLAGGPMGAILLILGLLVIALSSFASSTQKAAKDFEALNAEFERGEALLNDRVNAVKQASDVEIAEREEVFASEQELRKLRSKALADELRETTRFAAENGRNYQEAYDTSRALLLRKQNGQKLKDRDKETLQETVEFVNKYQAVQRKIEDLNSQILVNNANNRKADREEAIKALQIGIENERTYATERKAVQDQIASDAEKSFEQRIEAQTKANAIERKLIEDAARIARLTPGQTPAEISKIEVDRINAIKAARRAGEEALRALDKERIKRAREAAVEIQRFEIAVESEKQLEIATNENKSLDDRLAAQNEYLRQQESLIRINMSNELANAELTKEERERVEADANAQLILLRMKYLKDVKDITLASLEDGNADRVSNLNRENAEAITALNERYNAGKISLKEYNKERLLIERGYNFDVLELAIENLKLLAKEYEKQGKDVTQINEEIAKKEMELSDLSTKKRIEDLEKVRAAQMQLGEEIFSLFTTLVTAGYEKEKNAIQEQIDLNEEKKERDIEIATQTITDKQKQADEIAIIEARANAQREALERRQRQLDVQKARFDKQQTIAKIILDTARSVIAALTSTPPNVPLSIYVGLIGAASLAKAVATPIPAYAEGTDYATGGVSLVGDGGRREWGLTPGGSVFSTPAYPVLMDIPKGTKIFASDREAMEAGVFEDMRHTPRLVDSGSHYRYMTEKLGKKLDGVREEVKKGNKRKPQRAVSSRSVMSSSEERLKGYLGRNLQNKK